MMRVLLLLITLGLSWSAAAIDFAELARITATPATLSGQFQQTKTLKALDTSITSSGHFSYVRNQQINWVTERPLQSEITMTPNGIRSRQNGEVVMELGGDKQPAVKLMSDILFSVLTADWQALKQHFSMTGNIDGDNWDIELTPLTDELQSAVSRIHLTGARYLQQVDLTEASGDQVRITFDGLAE